MRYHALATDYDGTLAEAGIPDEDTLAALERVRATGRKVVLVTGRDLDDLLRLCPQMELFDHVVAENGAVLYRPATRATTVLAEPPPDAFADMLQRRGVEHLARGRVVVATHEPHETTVLEVIRELGLELQVIFNKGAVMVLPSGVNKAFGLKAALDDLGLSAHNTVAIGDAENDHALLESCECAVAVQNALPRLKERADWVTRGTAGAGVRELCAALVANDLEDVGLERRRITLGNRIDGAPVSVAPYGPPMLIAGTSGGGKSTLATSFLEELAERGYQYCVIDPEGDYRELEGATVLGSPDHAPGMDEVLEVLASPGQNAVACLVGVPLADRPAYWNAFFPRLQEMRARTGRPHWILIDETHHLMPTDFQAGALTLPRALHGLLLVTVHPEHVSPAILSPVDRVVAIGAAPGQTFAELAHAVKVEPPVVTLERLPSGEALIWSRRAGGRPEHFTVRPPRAERRRHVRKYAAGELGVDRSFYFRGPEGKLNLRAQNLQLFLQVAEGIDDETWLHHLRQGDYSTWFRSCIKDPDLAAEAADVEQRYALDPTASRAQIRALIDARYTAPA